MRACVGLIVLAALVVAPSAAAQDPAATTTPSPAPTTTPTPSPTPTPEEIEEAERKEALRKRKIVRRVYADFRRDGRVDNCDHSRTALKRTLESITDEFDTDFPDFREAVRAAIKDHDKERCAEEEEEPEATATPSPTSTPAPTATPAPPATEPQLAITRPDGDRSLLIPALLLAAVLAGLALLGASAVAARRGGRLAGWGHALREASYRATG